MVPSNFALIREFAVLLVLKEKVVLDLFLNLFSSFLLHSTISSRYYMDKCFLDIDKEETVQTNLSCR